MSSEVYGALAPGQSEMGIRILLADDHRVVREGLRALLEKESDMEIVGEANNGQTTVELAQELLPDVIVLDVSMPGLNGVETARRIVAESQGTKILVLSMYSDRQFVIGMFNIGASAYLLKDCAFDELATAIRAVVASHTYVSPSIANLGM